MDVNETTFNSIEEAVLCFYQSNNALRGEAQKYLSEMHNSPEIWSIIWETLLPSKHTELQFYGSITLHTKLLQEWADIPTTEYEGLKTKLLEAIVFFKDSSKVVFNRLCITMAVYVLRTTPAFWPNAISDLISMFQNAATNNINPATLTNSLLEILTVIPEEFQTIILSKNEKIFIRSSLENDSTEGKLEMKLVALAKSALNCNGIVFGASTVLALLEAAFTSSNFGLQLQVVKCAKSWLEFGLPPENCDVLLENLINVVLMTYTSEEYSQTSINAIEAISILCNHPNLDKLPRRVLYFLEKILLLADILNSSQEVSNCDLIPCIYTLFVNMGENHIKVYMNVFLNGERDAFLKLLYVILQCSNAPGSYPKDEVYSIQSFNFWYLLQDELVTSEQLKNTEIVGVMKPFYKKLVVVLMHKSMQPENMSGWSREDRDNFRCYRQDIADTYMYCHALLEDELVDIIVENLQQAIVCTDMVSKWREIESYLFAFYAVAENVVYSENPKILDCIHLLQKLPLSVMHVQVSQTTMELLGSYAEWLCSHPELLEPVLTLIFEGAENPQLAAPATLALKDITKECNAIIFPYAEQIAEKAVDILLKKRLKSNEEMRLIFSLGKVISLMKEETVFKFLNAVVTPYVQKVQSILSEGSNDSKRAEYEISEHIGIFTQLFLGLEVKPPVQCLLASLLPIFKEILSKYKGQKIVSAACIAIKCAVCNLGDDSLQLLPMIIEIVVTTYTTNPDHSLLELAKQLLLLFGNTPTCSQLMNNMLKEICVSTLTAFTNTTAENVSEHTSLFEYFYTFCTNVLKKNCKLLLNTDGINLVSMFRYAGFALCAQEVLTVKAAASFLCNAIIISREQDALLFVVQSHGAELVYHILIAIGKMSPRNCLEFVADVLLALSKKYCDWLSRWLNDILAQENFPSPRATSAAKKSFVKVVLREKANKRRVQEAAKEFSFLCRGLLNKDYVEHTTSSAL